MYFMEEITKPKRNSSGKAVSLSFLAGELPPVVECKEAG
jgi:hypothetical protein